MTSLRWLACSALAALLHVASPHANAQFTQDCSGEKTLQFYALSAPYDFVVDEKLYTFDCGHYIVFQSDGNLVVYNGNDEVQWGLNEINSDFGRNTAVRFETPGRLVAYAGSDVTWSTLDPTTTSVYDQYGSLQLEWFYGRLVLGFFEADEPRVIWSSDDPPSEPEVPPTDPPTTPTNCPEPPAPPPPHSYGDVHIRTPDGLAYAFQATGEFILSQFSGGLVLARQEAIPGRPHASINTAASMLVEDDVVGFYAKDAPHVTVNGSAATMDGDRMGLAGGGCLYLLGQRGEKQRYLVVWPGGDFSSSVIMNTSNGIVNIGVARGEGASFTVEGLLGNLDGDPSNDLTTSGGEVLSSEVSHNDLYSRFGVSWQIDAGMARYFRYASGSFESYRYDASQVRQARTLDSFTQAERQAAREACRRVSEGDRTVFRACLYDVAATGDLSFADLAATVSEEFQQAERSGRTRRATRTVASTTGWSFDESGGTCDVGFPISAGYTFTAGQRLYEPGCKHYLVYEDSGNLVIYNANDQPVRSLADLGLDTSSITGIQFLEGGRLVTINGGQEGWSNGDATQGGPYYLALVNGVLRIGALDGNRPRVIWSSQGRR